MRVVSRILAVAVLASTLSLATSAGPVIALSTYGDCDSGTPYPAGFIIGRLFHNYSGPLINGSEGNAVVRDVRSCTSPNVPATLGAAWVLPANLDSSSGIAQLGYGRVDCGSFSCTLPSNVRVFLYTLNDTSGGVVYEFAPSGLPRPILGHNYDFRIDATPNSLAWDYCISDLTAGGGFKCIERNKDWGGTSVWWAYEVNRSTDQLGGTSSSQSVLTQLKYRSSAGSTWTLRQQDSGSCNQPVSQRGTCDTEPGNPNLHSYHVVTAGNNGPPTYSSYLYGYTTPH